MKTILRIDASARTSGSVSRALGDHIETVMRASSPRDRIIRRDLVASPVPQIENETIAGFYTPADQMTARLRRATALSDELIGELRAADVLILTTPMYNFGVPSALKAWIDQIVRIGHTFAYDGTAFTGLLPGKTVYVLCAYGAAGYRDGQPFRAANFLEPYLRFLLNFLGISDVTFFEVEATTGDPAQLARNVKAVEAQIEAALASS